MATQRKAGMVARIAAKLGGPRSEGETALNAVLDSVREALAAGDRVVLTGFGAFEPRTTKERRVRPIAGPRAGQWVIVPARERVGFLPGSRLASAVRDRGSAR